MQARRTALFARHESQDPVQKGRGSQAAQSELDAVPVILVLNVQPKHAWADNVTD
jgi:hypothetical protein